jgi:hypothetical protein
MPPPDNHQGNRQQTHWPLIRNVPADLSLQLQRLGLSLRGGKVRHLQQSGSAGPIRRLS